MTWICLSLRILIRSLCSLYYIFLYSGATPMYCAGCEKFPAAFEAKNYYWSVENYYWSVDKLLLISRLLQYYWNANQGLTYGHAAGHMPLWTILQQLIFGLLVCNAPKLFKCSFWLSLMPPLDAPFNTHEIKQSSNSNWWNSFPQQVVDSFLFSVIWSCPWVHPDA